MLKMVAVNVIAVWLAFRTKVAVPKDAGLEPPELSVGTVGGFSFEFAKLADRNV